MRNTIAIYLLLLYVSAALLRPVMPVLMDGVAHVLFYQQHMEGRVCTYNIVNKVLGAVCAVRKTPIFLLISSPHFLTVTV